MRDEKRRGTNNKNKLLFVISWIKIHFGINPVNGGRPPKDNRDKNVINFTDGEAFLLLIWLKWNLWR